MIKLIDNITEEHKNEIVDFCADSCLGVKAVGSLLAYGITYDFATFWEQRDSNKQLTAFISKVYGSATVYANESADIKEITEFLSVIGYLTLVSDSRITGEDSTGYIMKLNRGIDCTAVPANIPHRFLVNTDLDVFYKEISRNNPTYETATYEDWLVDISHRIRHDTTVTIMASSVDEKDLIYSTACALAIIPQSVYLGVISTREEYRGKHFAYSCLDNLCNRYFDKKIFLMCKPDKVAFYEGAGFKIDGEFSRI